LPLIRALAAAQPRGEAYLGSLWTAAATIRAPDVFVAAVTVARAPHGIHERRTGRTTARSLRKYRTAEPPVRP